MFRRIVPDAFPPDITVIGKRDIGEDGILRAGEHGVLVGLHAGAGRDAEETGFRIDRAEVALFVELHPGDVVADGLDLPARNGRDQHGQVGLSAGRRERAGHILDFALRIGQLEDEHMLGHPAFVAGLHRRNAQGEALLAQQSVAAVTGAVGPDLAGFGEVSDVFFIHRRTGPDAVVALAGAERLADGVDAGNKFAVLAEHFKNFGADAGHDFHIDHNVRGIGEFDADLGNIRTDRAHREGNHIHRAALHAAVVKRSHGLLEFDRIDPVVGRAGILLLPGSDESTGFDTRHIGRIGAEQQAVRTLRRVQANGETGVNQLVAETVIFFAGTVTPVNGVGLAQLDPALDPLDQLFVAGRSRVELFRHDFEILRNMFWVGCSLLV